MRWKSLVLYLRNKDSNNPILCLWGTTAEDEQEALDEFIALEWYDASPIGVMPWNKVRNIHGGFPFHLVTPPPSTGFIVSKFDTVTVGPGGTVNGTV